MRKEALWLFALSVGALVTFTALPVRGG